MISEHVLRTGIKPTPYRKSFELITGTQSRVVNSKEQTNNFLFSVFPLCTTKVTNIEVFTIAIMLN